MNYDNNDFILNYNNILRNLVPIAALICFLVDQDNFMKRIIC
jgi:hypothetical protein